MRRFWLGLLYALGLILFFVMGVTAGSLLFNLGSSFDVFASGVDDGYDVMSVKLFPSCYDFGEPDMVISGVGLSSGDVSCDTWYVYGVDCLSKKKDISSLDYRIAVYVSANFYGGSVSDYVYFQAARVLLRGVKVSWGLLQWPSLCLQKQGILLCNFRESYFAIPGKYSLQQTSSL